MNQAGVWNGIRPWFEIRTGIPMAGEAAEE